MLSKTNPEQMESHTLPETNIAPARKPSPKETSLPTIHLHVPC